jgi:hypothetical protein
MTGTTSQIEWAELIRPRVNAEFDRVAAAFEAVSLNQDAAARCHTRAILAILEEKRTEVMAHDSAGYFIRDWQELNGQVRRMIADDPRFPAIRDGRKARGAGGDPSGEGQ